VPVVGVGVDLVQVDRFTRALSRTPALCDRLFRPCERVLPVHSLAVRFAAKEAVAKCLGSPSGLCWQDVEVRLDSDGRPLLEVNGTVAAAARRLGVSTWHVSLSHDAGMAVAMVVAES
jgi:holo-[acyl-carrier protein] synthase